MSDPLSEFRLDGDVAVVTGGAGGIGRAVADAARRRRCARRYLRPRGDGRGRLQGRRRRRSASQGRLRRGRRTTRAARHLFNNAGIAIRQPAAELTLDDWNKVVAVNMTGVFLCAREAARHMLASGRGGRIVNTASIMGFSSGGLYPNISSRIRRRRRPRVRQTTGGEATLPSVTVFRDRDPLSARMRQQPLAGVSTRHYEPVRRGPRGRRTRGSSKSAVSRMVVRRTRQRLHEHLARRLDELEVVALFMDGVVVAQQTVIVVLAITTEPREFLPVVERVLGEINAVDTGGAR